jgi:hypothetical protein
MPCGRLKSLPFFVCDKLVTLFPKNASCDTRQDSDRPTGDGESKASFSVKSYPQFSGTAAPSDFVKTAWEQYLHLRTTKFDKNHDFFGLITPPHVVNQKSDIDGLL